MFALTRSQHPSSLLHSPSENVSSFIGDKLSDVLSKMAEPGIDALQIDKRSLPMSADFSMCPP